MADDDTLHDGMARAARLGLPVAVHAEDPDLTSRLAAQAVREGRLSLRDYLHSRPVIAELEAIEQGRCHGRGDGMLAARRARLERQRRPARRSGAGDEEPTSPARPARTTSRSTRRTRWRSGWWRSARRRSGSGENSRTLWQSLLAGRVDLVASDHSPSPPELEGGRGRIRGLGRHRGLPDAAPRAAHRGPAAGAAPRADRRPRSGVAGTALPPRREGVARGGRGRRPGARRPRARGRPHGGRASLPASPQPVRGAAVAGAGRANDRTRLDCLARGRYGRSTGGPARTTGAPSVDGGEVGGVNVTVPGGTARKENRV